jgi:uncharacterized membrane protein/protein-disulfide isomerase
MTSTARRALVGFGLLGLGSSATSTYVHYRLLREPGYVSFCDVSNTVACTEAYLSRFGSVAGVPVALLGVIWFTLVLLLVGAAGRRDRIDAESVPGYVLVLSVGALAASLYLAYASFFVLRAVCLLCLITYAAVAGIFVVSAAATSLPMSTLPRRAWRDGRRALSNPTAVVVTLVFLLGAASAVAFFPREGVGEPSAEGVAPLTDQQHEKFLQWYASQPRIPVPVGATGAKVVIVKFNDYQCPPCRQTYLQYKGILAKYQARSPGLIDAQTKDFPLDPACNPHVPGGRHLAACDAAVAVRLAQARGRREAMEDWLFANQETLTPQKVRQGVREVAGVTDFAEQYPRALDGVRSDISLAGLLKVRVTPTFFINGVRVEGGLQPAFFDAAIAYELQRVQAK